VKSPFKLLLGIEPLIAVPNKVQSSYFSEVKQIDGCNDIYFF
jgi:hypothetical protein